MIPFAALGAGSAYVSQSAIARHVESGADQ